MQNKLVIARSAATIEFLPAIQIRAVQDRFNAIRDVLPTWYGFKLPHVELQLELFGYSNATIVEQIDGIKKTSSSNAPLVVVELAPKKTVTHGSNGSPRLHMSISASATRNGACPDSSYDHVFDITTHGAIDVIFYLMIDLALERALYTNYAVALTTSALGATKYLDLKKVYCEAAGSKLPFISAHVPPIGDLTTRAVGYVREWENFLLETRPLSDHLNSNTAIKSLLMRPYIGGQIEPQKVEGAVRTAQMGASILVASDPKLRIKRDVQAQIRTAFHIRNSKRNSFSILPADSKWPSNLQRQLITEGHVKIERFIKGSI